MTAPSPQPHLRVARPTDHLEAIAEMYARGLGLERLGSFEGHSGIDGVMLGRPGGTYHLEFTQERGKAAPGQPSPEHLLVLYLPDRSDWEAACRRMRDAGFRAVPAANPYWDRSGATFEDIEGYRVVLQQTEWPPGPPDNVPTP